MNIVFLTRRFYPDIGGVEKHVWEITKRLLAEGHSITIITESQDPRSQTKSLNDIRILRIPKTEENKNKKFFIWLWLWKKRAVLQNADLIHCHDVFYWYLPFRFLYPQKPVFTTFHGYEGYPLSKKIILVHKIAEKLSFGNLCIGDYIQKWYGTKPDVVSYGAVDITPIKETKKIKKDSALFIGRLDEQTGILEYLKSVKLLRKAYPKFSLLVVGDGKYRNRIPKDIKVLGFKEQPEKYFNGFHFAFVSRYLTTLEAMAAKKLVFCLYDNPLKKDCFSLSPFRNFIVMAENEKVLIKKVKYYLEHPDEEELLVTEAYHWVKKQSWEKMVKVYEKLWTKAKYDI